MVASLVGIITASQTENEALEPAARVLQRAGVPFDRYQAPVWHEPAALLRWLTQAERDGMLAVIAAAGNAPHLPGLVAAGCGLPVIAVPLGFGSWRDGEMMQLALATPPAAPVAAVEPGGAAQAGWLALRLLGSVDAHWKQVMAHQRTALLDDEDNEWGAGEALPGEAERQPTKVGGRHLEPAPAKQAREALEEFPPAPPARFADAPDAPVDVRPFDFNRPLSGEVVGKAKPEPPPREEEAGPPAARRLGRRRIDPDSPDVELIEEAVDCLLEGGIVALPTDTIYGLAVDATNAAAVRALLDLPGLSGRTLSLLVDSQKQLAAVAWNMTTEVRRLMEAFWPGPLTILLQKRSGNFSHVTPEEVIAVRLPDHSVPLAVMQALARPLAFTTGGSSHAEGQTAEDLEERHGDLMNLILDAGRLPEAPPSTVLDVTVEPYRILRRGGVTHAQLSTIVGDQLEDE